jgi:hypothetical protein
MFRLSDIRIAEQTVERLVVVDPPNYLGGIVMLAFTLVLLSAVFPSTDQTDGGGISWIALGLGVFCLIITVALLTGRTEMSFSRQTGVMKLTGTYAWIPVRTAETAVDQVRHAEVETRRDGRSLIVVTHSGNVIRLGAFSRRGGYHEAANAINDFVAGSATR